MVGVIVLVAGLLAVFNQEYVEPYATSLGQAVLAGVLAVFGVGVLVASALRGG